MAEGKSTKRSQIEAEGVTRILREQGAARLLEEEELTLVLDGMELRRPGAEMQAYLMRVKALDGGLVNGYRSFNVLGMGAGQGRGLLYHRLFSSNEPGFESENREIQAAIDASEQALAGFEGNKTWVIDRGFDNDDIWWQIWGYACSHLVVRVYHKDRIVLWQTPAGKWEERYLDATFKHLKLYAQVETEMEVRLKGQKRAKKQKVQVELSAVPIRIFDPENHDQTKAVWLVCAKIIGAACEPWYLITDWPVGDEQSALRIFIFYRRRWAVEDTFKFIKNAFGIEDVQMLDFQAVQNLVAYAWVAAGFLFELGLTLELPEIRLLAILGGWEERPDRPPGKQVITRGLRRLIESAATEAMLQHEIALNGDLPPEVKRLLAAYGHPLGR